MDYDRREAIFPLPESALLKHAKIYVATDFFNVPQLKEVAAQQI